MNLERQNELPARPEQAGDGIPTPDTKLDLELHEDADDLLLELEDIEPVPEPVEKPRPRPRPQRQRPGWCVLDGRA